MNLVWIVAAFLSGSLMFSYWLGLLLKRDIRTVRDGNPGAYNLWSVAGWKWGLAGVALDFLKGYLPARLLAISALDGGYAFVLIALAPILGHVFSPFLRGKGGKGTAVSFGVWSGLTQFEASLVYAIAMAFLFLSYRALNKGKPSTTEADSLQNVLGMMLLFAYLYKQQFPAPILWTGVGNWLIYLYTNRLELATLYRSVFKKDTQTEHKDVTV